MNVNLKSKELRKELKVDVLTPNISDKLVNHLTIRLDGPVSQDLLDDISAIAYDFPKLLRHVRIINAGNTVTNMQELVDHIADLRRNEPRFNLIEELAVETPLESELQSLNLSTYGRGKDEVKVAYRYTGPGRAKVSINKANISNNVKRFGAEGLDLASCDFSGTNLTGLTISGDGEVGFSQISGLENITEFEINNRTTLDREFEEMLDFVRTSGNVHTFNLDRVAVGDRPILSSIQTDSLVIININSCNMTDLSGLEFFEGKLAELWVGNNDLDVADFQRLYRFKTSNPLTYVGFDGNSKIDAYFANRSQSDFSPFTYQSITDEYSATQNKRYGTRSNTLIHLATNPLIPYSISDAKRVREAGITLNAFELDDISDLDDIDFTSDEYKGGTLLLSVEEIKYLMKHDRVLPIDVSIKIENASELSVETLREITSHMKIKDIRMVGADLSDNQRYPYSLVEYEVARGILDEVVAGIDPEEPDIDKFTTVYTRLKHAMVYDHRAIKHDTTDELRYSNKQVNNCRNLVNGLRNGTCVCAGFAETLRNALALVGIDARYIRGDVFDDPDKHGYHAWNLVTLKGSDGVKRQYLADLTWEAHTGPTIQPGEETQNNYALLDYQTFARDHRRTFSRGVTTEPHSYDRPSLHASFARALKRMLNPRERYEQKLKQKQTDIQRQQEERRKQEEERRKREQERIRKEIEAKQRAIAKAKAEAEKQRLEEEKKKLEEEAKKKKAVIAPEEYTIPTLVDLIYKNKALRKEIENIRKTITENDLPQDKKVEYSRKLNELVNEVNSRQDIISDMTGKLLGPEEEKQANDDKRIKELESKRFKLQLRRDEALKTSKQVEKKKVRKTKTVTDIVYKHQEPKAIDPSPEFLNEERVEMVKAELRSALENMEALTFSHRANHIGPGRFQRMQELRAKIDGITIDSEEVIQAAREAEVEALVTEYRNKDVMTFSHRANKLPREFHERQRELAKRLSEYGVNPNLTEEVEKVVEYEEEVEVPVEKPVNTTDFDKEIADITTELEELKLNFARREGNLRIIRNAMELSRERNIEVQEIAIEKLEIPKVEIKEEDIEETEKVQEEERREREIYGDTKQSIALETERDLYRNEKQHRMDYMARRFFDSDYDGVAAPVRAAINFSTTVSMAVSNLVYRIRNGESKYAKELEVTKNLEPINKGVKNEPIVDGSRVGKSSVFDERYEEDEDRKNKDTERKSPSGRRHRRTVDDSERE